MRKEPERLAPATEDPDVSGTVERRTLVELFRCLACGLHLAAGLAQRWALAGLSERRPSPIRA